MHDSGEDPISLSFIDCISCGLAAALFMFLVFAAIPRGAATAAAEIATSSGGLTGSGLSVALPVFDGGGGDVPVDIRIALDRSVSVSEAHWKNAKKTFEYLTETGQVEAFLASFRSSDQFKDTGVPEFLLKRTATAASPIHGQITIKAGHDTAISVAFECPVADQGNLDGEFKILSFTDDGRPKSQCIK
ncbi:hypothetical protein [Mesorhizobium sp.]|uniref:hypothetical protein n=1 Tax=Mesorhizobium sp. TaxID=1871066 RepID=UPI000FE5A93C|nr:hypothetical protein [Mesorhizobium sp.]RWB26415.1 MAG: hypothetical protein EOQ43_30840 [Mesorhizobium sp.]